MHHLRGWLECPFCAYGLEKKLKNLDGVRSLDITLRLEGPLRNAEGVYRASVDLPDGLVTVESIGRELRVRALAKVVESAGSGFVPEEDADRPVGRSTRREEDKR